MGRAKLFVKCEFCKREMSTTEEIFPVRVFDGPDNRYPHYVPCCCGDCANALIEKQLDDLLAQYKIIDNQKVTPISFKKYIGAAPMQTTKKDIQEPHSSFFLFGGKHKEKKSQNPVSNVPHPSTPASRPAKPVAPQAKRNQVPNPKPEYPYQRPQTRPVQQPASNSLAQAHARPVQGTAQPQRQSRPKTAQRPAMNGQQQRRPSSVPSAQYPQQHMQRPAQKYQQRPQPEHTASKQPSHTNRHL